MTRQAAATADDVTANTTGTTARSVSAATTMAASMTTMGTLSTTAANEASSWRIRERVRTVAAGLILCLHLGVDPPDVLKTVPTARLECWTDPETATTTTTGGDGAGAGTGGPRSAGEIIMRNLQQQYEFWQPKARYKALLDPTGEEVRRLCVNLRKSAKDERILLHYNGHGVPRPTRAGELWAFNKQYTQYIPLSAAEVAGWIGTPVLVVVDSSAAANVGAVWQRLAERHGDAEGADVLMMAACGAEELLPMAPEMPADLFTSCLTTPMEIAIRWHLYRGGPLLPSLTLEAAMSIPGRLNDRRTPLGELNWILTAITDTIGWTVLPRPLFQRLFRQDVLVASLFRNYLLAVRVMRAFRCTPQSWPPIPTAAVASHELWQAWDQALDAILVSLQGTAGTEGGMDGEYPVSQSFPSHAHPSPGQGQGQQSHPLVHGSHPPTDVSREASSPFFLGQMDAFKLWIQQRTLMGVGAPPVTSLHLPSVLQVLLSQTHRSRALTLLGHFCDLGTWAVRDSLHVGVFPYLLKLFQSPASDIRYALLYIWLRILRFDPSVVGDLGREEAWRYFVRALVVAAGDPAEASIEAFEMRTMAAVGLCLILLDHRDREGTARESRERDPTNVAMGGAADPAPPSASLGLRETLAADAELIDTLLEAAGGATPLLSEWALHLLSVLPWRPSSPAVLQRLIFPLLEHERCANRTAAIHLLGALLERIGARDGSSSHSGAGANGGEGGNNDERAHILEMTIVYRLLGCLDECHPGGRRELVIALSRLVARHPSPFTLAAYDLYRAEVERRDHWQGQRPRPAPIHGHGRGCQEERARSGDTANTGAAAAAITNSNTVASNWGKHLVGERRVDGDALGGATKGSSQLRVVAPGAGDIVRHPSINTLVWEACLILAVDPCAQVSVPAAALVDEIHMSFLLGGGDLHHAQSIISSTTDHEPRTSHHQQPVCQSPATPPGTEVIFVQQQQQSQSQQRSGPITANVNTNDRSNSSAHAAHAPTPILTTSSASEAVVLLPSALPLTSDLIRQAADAFIEHQRRRREMLLRKHEPSVYARLRKVSLVDGEEVRRWTSATRSGGGTNRRFEHPLAVLSVSDAPITNVLFHPLSGNKLIVTDAAGIISTWKYRRSSAHHHQNQRAFVHHPPHHGGGGGGEKSKRMASPQAVALSMFRGAHARTQITGIACVDWDPIKLLVGTSDGVVRLYCDFATEGWSRGERGDEYDGESVSGMGRVGINDHTDDEDEGGGANGETEIIGGRTGEETGEEDEYEGECVTDLRMPGAHANVRPRTRMIAAWSTLATETTQDLVTQCTLLEWNQHQRRLYTVTGGTQLAVLDAAREQIVERLALPTHSQASALTSDRRESPIVTLGFADGAIRRYDLRQPTSRRAIASWQTRGSDVGAADGGIGISIGGSSSSSSSNSGTLDTTGSPLVVSLRQSWMAGQELLLTASQGGELVEWDLRTDPTQALGRRMPMGGGSRLMAMDQHRECGMVATGGDGGVRVLETARGSILGSVRHHEGFLGKRLAPVVSLAFHPRQLLLAAGCADGLVPIYRADP